MGNEADAIDGCASAAATTGPIIRPFEGVWPRVDSSAWIAAGAVVVGDVEIGPDSSVWYGTVVRGDVHRIRLGARSNLQDGVVVHVTAGRFGTVIGDDVTVGHRAVVHGCTVGDRAMIGIGATVLDGAEIGEDTWVAAGSLVTPGTRIESGVLAMGTPAKVVRALSAEDLQLQLERTRAYVTHARKHAAAGGWGDHGDG